MDNDELLGDVVASVVEKVLMNVGLATHAKVIDILDAFDLIFSDCYRNPDVLNFALKEVFDNDHLTVVEKIKIGLSGLEDYNPKLVAFIQKLGK
ncbi:MAG: hypothetical protein ACREBI_10160 [Nitrosotalea sp.]